MTISRAITSIKIAALVLCIGGGLLVAFGAHPSTSFLANLFIDLAHWPVDGAQRITTPEARFLAAIGGGAFTAMGVGLWFAAEDLARDATRACKVILATALAWFVTDSTASIVAGAPLNALYNVPLVLAFALPILQHKSTITFDRPDQK